MFTPNQLYRRKDLHQHYGGNPQSGISPSAKFPYIFIFTGSSGKRHGYKDQWENDKVFSYTGEGQVGNMEYTKGNLKLRDHFKLGMRVFLFQYVRKGEVQFISEMEFFDSDYFDTHDRNGDLRIGIKFFFRRKGIELPVTVEQLKPDLMVQEPEMIYHPSIRKNRKPNKTERRGLLTSRVGQGAYRQSILHRWEYQCAVTQFDNPRILIASHIIPWKKASDEERLDVDNGILLSPDVDALFDRHLISFDENGKILLGKEIKHHRIELLGLTGNEKVNHFSEQNQQYLEKHRTQLR